MSSAKTKKRKRKSDSPDGELKRAFVYGLKLFKPIGKTIKQTVSSSKNKNIKRSLFGGKTKRRRRRRRSRKIKKRRRKKKKRRK